MPLGPSYPKIGSANPITGQNLYTVIDTYNTALENNGALQPLGTTYEAPLNPASLTTAGIGLTAYYKYVRYNPTTTQTIQAGPALLYWKDETFTTVTPLYSEAYLSALQSSGIAGWLLYNTTSLSSAAASLINGNFCWMLIGGFLPGAYVTAGTAGQGIYGVATGAAWATTTTAPAPARLAGLVLTAASSNLSDLYVPFLN
jgi:hypothetical protein